MSFTVTGIGSTANGNHLLFQRGDAQNGAGSPKKISGLEAMVAVNGTYYWR